MNSVTKKRIAMSVMALALGFAIAGLSACGSDTIENTTTSTASTASTASTTSTTGGTGSTTSTTTTSTTTTTHTPVCVHYNCGGICDTWN